MSVREQGLRTGPLLRGSVKPRERLAAHAVSAWLGGIVVVATILQVLAGRTVQSPQVFTDELASAELARNFSHSGHFLVRDLPTTLYGPLSRLYPVLIGPAFGLAEGMPQAFVFVKGINAVLMSLAAIPSYFIARRLLSQNVALLAAALTVAVPSVVYSSMVLTENAAYPAFLLFVLAMVRALEKPTARRQVAVLAAVVLVFFVRAQGVILLPAYLTATVLVTSLNSTRGARLRALRSYAVTGLALLAGSVAVIVAEFARGRSPRELIGSYAVLAGDVRLMSVPRWFLYHVADLDLYLGVLPFVAFCALLPAALRGRLERRLQIFILATLSLVIWMTLLVAALSSSIWGIGSLHERNLFYVAPLFVVAFLALLARNDVPRPRLAFAGGIVAVAAVIPLTLPFRELGTHARVDALALLPWWNALVSPRFVPVAMSFFAASLGCLVFVHRRHSPVAVALVALNFLVIGMVANWRTQLSARTVADVRVNRNWIDAAVGPHAEVAALWVPNRMACVPLTRWYYREVAAWENEFFNSSVRRMYYLGKPLDALPASSATPNDETFATRYVAVAEPVRIHAPAVARDAQTRTVLYRVTGPVRITLPQRCGSGLALGDAAASGTARTGRARA